MRPERRSRRIVVRMDEPADRDDRDDVAARIRNGCGRTLRTRARSVGIVDYQNAPASHGADHPEGSWAGQKVPDSFDAPCEHRCQAQVKICRQGYTKKAHERVLVLPRPAPHRARGHRYRERGRWFSRCGPDQAAEMEGKELAEEPR